MKFGNILLAVCIVCGTTFLIGLGVWQMNRLEWKMGLVERVKQNMAAPPLTVAQVNELIDAGEDIEYRPMKAKGHFLHDKESHFFATYRSSSGYFVYTPLRQADGTILMVNRGYTPPERKDNKTRKEGLTDGEVELVGLARSAPSEKPNSFVPNNDLAKNVYYWKSINQMLGRVGDKMNLSSERFFMDVNAQPTPGRWPLGGVTRIEFPNSHLQYAMTWFGLAMTLLGVGGLFLYRRVKGAD